MILRRHTAPDGTRSEAAYSPCETYRYRLTRRWAPGPPLVCIMLNPSTATEAANDPTIARVQARARGLGLAAVTVVNLFALRATDPRRLRDADDPIGPLTDASLLPAMTEAGLILCAWGNHGDLGGRAATVTARLRATGQPLCHLGLTAKGQPRHPLYVATACAVQPWLPGNQAASS